VLLTGERDFNRVQTRVIRREMEKEGFRAVTYLEVPRPPTTTHSRRLAREG
jgi:hypothetical protein